MFAHVQAVVGKCIYCICSCRATLLEIVMRDTSVAHKCYDPGAYGSISILEVSNMVRQIGRAHV